MRVILPFNAKSYISGVLFCLVKPMGSQRNKRKLWQNPLWGGELNKYGFHFSL